MHLIDKPIVGFDNGIKITFLVPITAKEELKPLFDTISEFTPEQEYILSLTRAKKPRSIDANAYMWVLCDKIAQVLRSTKEEVYRRAIKEVGVFSDVAVQQGEPCQALVSSWGSNGIGYFSELFDTTLTDKNGNPMKRVRLYKGSHTYSQKELSRVIDYICEECKNLGIPIMSETQIKELEASWK